MRAINNPKDISVGKTSYIVAMTFLLAMSGCEGTEDNSAAFREAQHAAMTGSNPPGGVVMDAVDAKTSLPRIDEQSTLRDMLAYAAMNNPGLEAAFHEWKAAVEQVPQEKSLPDPQFTFGYFAVDQAMRDGDLRYTYGVAQTFPWWGKLELRGDMAAREAQATYRKFENERLSLYNRVKLAYYEYFYVVRAVAITQENIRQLRAISESAEARYRTGGVTQADVIRTQVEVGKMDNELRSLSDLLEPTAATLNATMNRPADAPLPAPRESDVSPSAIDVRQLMDWMASSSPELGAWRRTSSDSARPSNWPGRISSPT
jgi:outer membrane protein TolC